MALHSLMQVYSKREDKLLLYSYFAKAQTRFYVFCKSYMYVMFVRNVHTYAILSFFALEEKS